MLHFVIVLLVWMIIGILYTEIGGRIGYFLIKRKTGWTPEEAMRQLNYSIIEDGKTPTEYTAWTWLEDIMTWPFSLYMTIKGTKRFLKEIDEMKKNE